MTRTASDASTPAFFAVPSGLASPALFRPAAASASAPRVDRAEMLRYLGYRGQKLDADLAERIEGVAAELERNAAARGVRQVFPVDASGLDADGIPCIRLVGTAVELRGHDIYRHLKDARCCALLACTLGLESERRLRVLASQQPLESAVFDAACSAYVESAVEKMDEAVRRDAGKAGLAANWRFSCGYGDCPLDAQAAIVSALNATRLIGLTVTPSNLLLPSKSVTAMIGLFDGEPHAADSQPTCAICRMRERCAFRARGTTCYPKR